MQGNSLRFRSVAGQQIPNIAAFEAGIKRFIGWRFIEVEKGVYGFQRVDDVDTVPWHPDYARFVSEGAIVPADAETAALCGVRFSAPEPVKASDDKTKGGK